VTGDVVAVPAAGLLTDASFAVLTPPARAPLPARGVLDGLPAEVAGRAQWWERHVTEVLAGVPSSSTSRTSSGVESTGHHSPGRSTVTAPNGPSGRCHE
jgi:hypothetical protein